MSSRIDFMSFPREMQLMICTKMDNLEVVKLSATCSYADRFVNRHKKPLYSRIGMGESIILEATQSGVFVRKQVWKGKCKNKCLSTDDVDFYKNISPVAVRQLAIFVKDTSMIHRVLDVLKKWNPVCQMATIMGGGVPSEFIPEIDNCIRYTWNMVFDCPREKGSEMFSNIRKVKNPGMHILRLPAFARYENLSENTRDFGAFKILCNVQELGKFLRDLDTSKNSGNLRQVSFTFLCKRVEALRIPLLLVPGLPETKLVFRTSEGEKSGARCVLKLPLNNGNCALIHERNCWRPLSKIVDIVILKDSETEILNFLIGTLEIEKYFPGNSRTVLLVMSEEQRMTELQMAYTSSREVLRMMSRLNISSHPASP